MWKTPRTYAALVILDLGFETNEERIAHQNVIEELAYFGEQVVFCSSERLADKLMNIIVVGEGKNDSAIAAALAQFLEFKGERGRYASVDDLINFVAAFRGRLTELWWNK